jgi:hypothetical protein
MDITPIRKSDIEIGKPLKWPIYGKDKKLLLREGFVIESQNQLDRLIGEGMFRNPAWQRPAPSAPHPDEEEKDTAPNPQERRLTFSDIGLSVGDSLQIQPLSRAPLKITISGKPGKYSRKIFNRT